MVRVFESVVLLHFSSDVSWLHNRVVGKKFRKYIIVILQNNNMCVIVIVNTYITH